MANYTILKIQRNILFKNVVKTYNVCKYIFDDINSFVKLEDTPLFFTEMEYLHAKYEHLTAIIQDKNVIKVIDGLVNRINRFHNMPSNIIISPLTTRKFLVAWVIASFPEYTINISRENLKKNQGNFPEEIYFISRDFISSFIKLVTEPPNNEIMRLFKKKTNIYCNAINYFLNRDKA